MTPRRLSETFSLAPGAAGEASGNNSPLVGVRGCGRSLGDTTPSATSANPLGAIGYWRRGELGLRSWVRSLRGVDEAAWLARDDLRPFGLMCARMAWRGVTRRLPAGQSNARGPSALLRAAGGPRYRPGPRISRDTRESLDTPDITEFNAQGERV